MANTNYTLPQDASQNLSAGFDQIFLYVNEQVPAFIPSLLFSVFLTIFLVGTMREQIRTQNPGFLKWMTVASIITSTTATFLSLINGLVTADVLVITYVLTAIIGLFYIITETR